MPARFYPFIESVNGRVYLFGENEEGDGVEMLCFDVKKNEWLKLQQENVEESPGGISACSVNVSSFSLVCIGGLDIFSEKINGMCLMATAEW